MERSLSALLPVRNAEATLAETVSRWLEILPEMTSRFELVIIDDGSSDATIEIADELGGQYPQLIVVRHGHAQGRAAAVATGMKRARGEVIFLADEDGDVSLDEIRRIWSGRSDDRSQRTDQPTASSRPRRPNYLARLRDLVFGQ